MVIKENASSLFKQWQPAILSTKNVGSPLRAANAKPIKLSQYPPDAQPFSCGDKAQDKLRIAELAQEIDLLQDKLLADGRYKVLVVLQGTDTSGKDGALREVFSRTSPLGVRTVGWKAPTENELAHDYLWRIHKVVPATGEIVVFNRSHYEDVLVPVVNKWITAKQTWQRYAQINDFERMLAENGTVILKFMLHISFEEQRKRLQLRIDDKTKNWKFNISDLVARKQWPQYQAAYAALLGATSTSWAPWTIVPSDSKTHRSLMIATAIRDTLRSLGLRYPPEKPELAGLIIK